ncbi:MAG: metalloprotease PmbA [Gammaproteobacteria bacterium]|nr:MAG: metalloprotease PmbA [Gammaproteobacteria bacterium]
MSQITSDELDIDLEKSTMSQLIQDILDEAKKLGATSAEVGVSKQVGLSVNVRNNDVETIEFNRDCGFGITVFVGQRKGNASTSDTSPSAIKAAVGAATSIAKQTTEDPYAGLVDPKLLATDIKDLQLDHPMGITPETAIERAKNAEQALLATDKRIKSSDGTSFASHRGIRMYGNSHGFLAGYPTSRHLLSAVAIAEDSQGMQRDYYYTGARNPNDLLADDIIGTKAAQRSVSRLGAKSVPTGSFPVLLSPEVAAGFIGHFSSAIRGGSLYRKSSFLVDHLGKQIFPSNVSIEEKPFILGALGSAPFDAEGVETREQYFIHDGILENYILSSYSARRLGLSTTANAGGVHNLLVSNSNKDLQQLLAEMQNGLLVTEVMGQGVNIVTGDYSRGASGFWVSNGEIQFPVEEITIAGNLKSMMANIVAIGNDYDPRLSTQTGSVLLESMMIAGN